MKVLVVCVLVLMLLAGGLLLYRRYYLSRRSGELARQKYEAVEPLLEKLAAGLNVGAEEILTMAKDPSLRQSVFRLLEEYGKADLFPREFMTRQMGAESFLVNWLEYPTELGTAPNHIELLEAVSHEELEYFVFRFRTMPPHWAAVKGWMMGVSGPYSALAMPFDPPLRVFSRFKGTSIESPAREVQWVHENINPG